MLPQQLLTCSGHQKTKPRILQFTNLKCCIQAREPFKTLINGVLFLIYYFKKHSKPCFYILKTFCSTLNSWIGELENLWYRFLMSRTAYTTKKLANRINKKSIIRKEKVMWMYMIWYKVFTSLISFSSNDWTRPAEKKDNHYIHNKKKEW